MTENKAKTIILECEKELEKSYSRIDDIALFNEKKGLGCI